jgi:hypothetical protein
VRSELWKLLGLIGLAAGVVVLILGVALPAPSCCSQTANGMTQCVACIHPLFSAPLLVAVGVLIVVLGLVFLVAGVLRRPQPTS